MRASVRVTQLIKYGLRSRLIELSAASRVNRDTVLDGSAYRSDPSKIGEMTRRHYAAIYARPGAIRSAFARFLAIDQKDEADNLKAMETKLTMPVLAIGAAKAFGANVAVVMRNAATNVQEVVVPNAGHWLMEEAPAATIAAVQDFIAAH